MADGVQTLTVHPDKDVPLTHGLARNTLFNLAGWALPVLLAFISVPYIVSGLGDDAYGIYGIVSIVAGYLGMLNDPVAMGNVRFMAEAYGRQDWYEFRKTTITGLVVTGALAALGSAIMFVSADALATNVFKIPASLAGSATVTFRIGAASFFLNGLTGALRGIPSAMRRYGTLNVINMVLRSLNTAGVVLAIWLGWGLRGAVMAQFLSSLLAAICFAVVASSALRGLPVSGREFIVDAHFMRQLISFSSLLFLGRILGQVSLWIDRTIIGIFLGTAAVTLYIVPANITDLIPGFMGGFTATLYPLSAEAKATGKLDELRRLYLDVERSLLWVSSFFAAMLISLSYDVLAVWISPEMAAKSQWVLILLAGAALWRAPGTIAYQVNNGVGRADILLWSGVTSAVAMTLGTVFLVKPLGIVGVAFGVFALMIPLSVGLDLFTQRKALQQRVWRHSLAVYPRSVLTLLATVGCVGLIIADLPVGWGILFLKGILVSIIFLMFSVLFGALRMQDIRQSAVKFQHLLNAMK